MLQVLKHVKGSLVWTNVLEYMQDDDTLSVHNMILELSKNRPDVTFDVWGIGGGKIGDDGRVNDRLLATYVDGRATYMHPSWFYE